MEVAAVVLAAGAGTRLRPLTLIRPKAMCPVANVPLVDHAITRAGVASRIAVNVHHGREMLEQHLDGRVHISVEEPGPLGTAGALVKLRDWIDGADVLVLNADAWHAAGIEHVLKNWDRERIRLLVALDERRSDFRPGYRQAGVTLMPWREVAALPNDAFGLYETSWRKADEAGRIDFVETSSQFIDCGTPDDYYTANMAASGGVSVIGDGAVVEGEAIASVLWPGTRVRAGERLEKAVRAADDVTLYFD